MAEPVLAFQFPEMDVLLRRDNKSFPPGARYEARREQPSRLHRRWRTAIPTCTMFMSRQGEAGERNQMRSS